MQTQHFFVLVIISFFLLGCPADDNMGDRYYTIENQSNHSLLIKFYRDGNIIDHMTTILSENSDTFTRTLRYTNDEDNFTLPYFAYRSADSIVIDFDDVKRQIYTLDFNNKTLSEPIDRNIYRHENYENLGKDRFFFKVTEEDYNNAVDI